MLMVLFLSSSNLLYGSQISLPSYSINGWDVWDGWRNNPGTVPSNNVRVDGYYHESNCRV